jgi:hemin uptake protein HemP
MNISNNTLDTMEKAIEGTKSSIIIKHNGKKWLMKLI